MKCNTRRREEVNQTETVRDSDQSTEKTNMVHLEDWGMKRADRAWCGAPVKKYLPSTVEVDCVVCAGLYEAWLAENA